MSRSCLVGTATRLRAERYGFRILVGASDFSPRQNVHTASRAHQASYSVRTGVHFRGVKWQRREVNHSTPSSAEVKNVWSYASVPLYAFMEWAVTIYYYYCCYYCHLGLVLMINKTSSASLTGWSSVGLVNNGSPNGPLFSTVCLNYTRPSNAEI